MSNSPRQETNQEARQRVKVKSKVTAGLELDTLLSSKDQELASLCFITISSIPILHV